MSNVRQCQPCTACCDGWVQIKVKGCEAYPGKKCPHSTEGGCDDYHNRPVNPCRKFECAWVQSGSHLPDYFRPDQAGVLVLDNAFKWEGVYVDVAVPVGKQIPQESLEWLQAYAKQNLKPLVYQQQNPNKKKLEKNPLTYAFGPPAFQQWVVNKVNKGEKLW